MLRRVCQVVVCTAIVATIAGESRMAYGKAEAPFAAVYTCGDPEPSGLLDIDAVALRVYSMEDVPASYWLRGAAGSAVSRTRWYYLLGFKVKRSGGEWSGWTYSNENIPPADWAGCQKILLVVHNIEPGDLVQFSVQRQYATQPYRDVVDCNDGTTMTVVTNSDSRLSDELGPGEGFDAYYLYAAE